MMGSNESTVGWRKSIVKIIYVTTCTCVFVSLHYKDIQMFMLFSMSLSE
jgi:hypothetical protein